MPGNHAMHEKNMKLLYGMLNNHVISRLIYSVARVGIPDLIKEDRMHYEQLADRAYLHPRALYRVMRTLSSVNVFIEVEDGVFKLDEIGQLLRTDVPGSQHALAVLMWEPWWRHGWDELLYSLETGDVAFNHIHGTGLFEYLKQHPVEAELFNKAMTSITVQEITAIMDAYDFSGAGTVVDIGGGQERTLSEYERLLNASGFKLRRIISTNSAMSIVEAMPV